MPGLGLVPFEGDDEEDEPKPSGAEPSARGLALVPFAGDDEDGAQPAQATNSAPRPSMGTGSEALDTLLSWYTGMAEAATGNHFGEIGQVGTKLGTWLADQTMPSLARSQAPEPRTGAAVAGQYADYGGVAPGNVDLKRRPHVQNPNGQTSTVRSMGVGLIGPDGKVLEHLIPTVSNDGRLMEADEAFEEFRRTGQHLGTYKDVPASNAAAEAIHKDQEQRPPLNTLPTLQPEYAGERGANADELVQRSMDSGAGKAGYVAGVAAPALLGASPVVSAAAIPTRAAVGAVQGAAAQHGENPTDPLSILLAGAGGGAAAAAGGALASRAASPAPGQLFGSRAEQALEWLGGEAKRLGSQMLGGAGLGLAISGLSGKRDPADLAWSAAKGAGGAAALRYAGAQLPKAAPAVPAALAAGGTAAAPFAGRAAAAALGPSKAKAQDDKAYGTAPTMAWAVQSVLSGGNTGLAPADEQRLTEALLSGNEDRVISANFTLQQKSPAYAARLQRELEALQEE